MVVYAKSGIEIYSLTLTKPFVSMCAYEQLLVYCYHDSVPMYGCQNIKTRIYDIENR